MASEYEKLRLKNIEDNRRILQEIGLTNPFKKSQFPRVTFKKAIKCKTSLKRKAETELEGRTNKVLVEEDLLNSGSLRGSRRRSARIQGKETPTEDELKNEVDEWEKENEGTTHQKVPQNRPKIYGAIEGVEVGTVWPTRMESCRAGIHRPTVAGIHAGPEGAYSIALSGGYDDNIDLGEGFTYTGEGGRDLKGTRSNPKNLRTAPQSKDQTLTRGNLALSVNVTSGHPVRVIRGYKLNSPFAPEDGYRYDGLYNVEKAWFTTGLSGFGVWKFALRRCADQAPPPWTFAEMSSPLKSDKDGDKLSEADNKSDSGFDSDETGSHVGSQASDITSSQGSNKSDSSTGNEVMHDGNSEKDEKENDEGLEEEKDSKNDEDENKTEEDDNENESEKDKEDESEIASAENSGEKMKESDESE